MKRRWLLWILLIWACLVIVIGVSELAGISISNIFGWGAIGILGIILYGVLSLFLAMIASIIAYSLKLLLNRFIPNGANLYYSLGALGLSVVLAGYFLTVAEFKWSILIVAVGFFLGWLSGMEFQRTKGEQEQLKNELYQRRIEKTDSAMKAMTIEDLLIIKEKYSDDIGITAFVDEFLEERGKSANENQG